MEEKSKKGKRKAENISTDETPAYELEHVVAEIGNDEDILIKCGKCDRPFPKSGFSNKQYKRHVRDKTAKPHCTSCAKEIANGSESQSQDKQETAKQPAISTPQPTATDAVKDPSLQYLQKPETAPIVHDFRRFFRKQYGIEDHQVHMDKKTRWRTAVKLAVRGEWTEDKKSIGTHIGLFQPGTHKVIDCTQSIAHHSRVNKAVIIVQECMKKIGLTGYIEGHGADESLCSQYKSFVRYLLVSVERSSGKVQLTLIWNAARSNKEANKLLDELIQELLLSTKITNYSGPEEKSSNLFHSIWVNHYPASKHCNAIMGREAEDWILRFGSEAILEKVMTDMKNPPSLCFPPFVFRQANIDGFTSIIQDIRQHVKEFAYTQFPEQLRTQSDERINEVSTSLQPIYCLELYGGVGTIGLNCLDYLKKLSCCDENPNNEKCFNATANKLLSEKKSSSKKDEKDKAFNATCCYATYGSATVCTNVDISNFDLIIVDPPRKGLDEETLYALIYPSKSTQLTNKRKSVLFEEDFKVLDPNDITTDGKQIKHELRRLIYVSCGFEAFKRDCHVLTGWVSPPPLTSQLSSQSIEIAPTNKKIRFDDINGADPTGDQHVDHHAIANLQETDRVYWKLVYVKGFILFPGSNHIETLAVFDRIYEPEKV
jgi:tRNA/tmRNA/rRNA uracil-C5-methylase (TrmA/RlmC/RlmD family)